MSPKSKLAYPRNRDPRKVRKLEEKTFLPFLAFLSTMKSTLCAKIAQNGRNWKNKKARVFFHYFPQLRRLFHPVNSTYLPGCDQKRGQRVCRCLKTPEFPREKKPEEKGPIVYFHSSPEAVVTGKGGEGRKIHPPLKGGLYFFLPLPVADFLLRNDFPASENLSRKTARISRQKIPQRLDKKKEPKK